MSTYEERLATFTSNLYGKWPHASPTSKDLAAAGFIYTRSRFGSSDDVKCPTCKIHLDEWERGDDAIAEHIRHRPSCSAVKMTVLEVQKEASKSTPKSPQDLGFFDPSLQQEFLELNLFHDVLSFSNHLKQCSIKYREKDVIQMLPKCLRGSAYEWCRDLPESLDLRSSSDRTLDMWLSALEEKFKKETPVQPIRSLEASYSPERSTPQVDIQYHVCTVCSASFSSISRLLSHSRSGACNKASCNHCDEVFDSKNKLHEHIRESCSANKSKGTAKPSLLRLERPEIASEKTSNIAGGQRFEKGGVECTIKTKPTPLHKESPATIKPRLAPLAPTEISPPASPATSPLPAYRAVSPPPPTYTAPRSYLTIDDLYMRYAPLRSVKSSRSTRPIRPVTVLSTLTVKDLYERFKKSVEKSAENIVVPPTKWTPRSPANQKIALKSPSKCSIPSSKATAKTPILAMSKSTAQASNTQQRRHIKHTKHGALVETITRIARRATTSPKDLAVAVDGLARKKKPFVHSGERNLADTSKALRR